MEAAYLAFGIIAPRIQTGVFFAGHRMTPSRMRHVVSCCGGIEALSVQSNVSQALQRCHIGDVRSRCLGTP